MKKQLSKSQKVSIFMYILILLLVQLPWLKFGGKRYNIWQGSFQIKDSLITAEFIWFVIYQILCCMYIVTLLCKRNWPVNVVTEIVAIMMIPFNELGWGMWSEDWIGTAFIAVFILLGGAEFFVSRMMNTWTEALEMARKAEKKERQEKQEERRRLYFPGKYPKLFYRVVWKNFIYNKRDYILFVICGVLLCGLTLAGFGMYEMMAGLHTEERLFLGNGLGKIIQNAMLPLGVCIVFLLVFVLVFYLKKRTQSYSMFVTLGIRKKTMFGIMALEMAFSIICSVVLGLLAGRGILFIFRKCARMFLGEKLILSSVTWKAYMRTLGVVALVYLASFMATRDIFTDFNIISASSRSLKDEKIPKRALKRLTFAGGAAIIWGVSRYTQISCYEKLPLLAISFIGIYFLLRFGSAQYLRRLRRSKKYLTRLLQSNHIYHKSRTSVWYMLVLTGLHIFVMFYFLFQVISVTVAEGPNVLYPYDFMCIADDGDDIFFERLKKEYGVELSVYPMVRVANADNTEKTEGLTEGSPPQGQNIGISETTYYRLKKESEPGYKEKPLHLDDEGKKVYLVHQQDKSVRAQPVDWVYTKTKPRLHVGPVCEWFSIFDAEANISYPPREIAGEEIASLTGCFRQGWHEDLVVFSDAYFEKAKELWKSTDMYTGKPLEEGEEAILDVNVRQGPTKLVLIRAKESDIDSLQQEMEELDKRHAKELKYDMDVCCWYSKKDAVADLKTERILKPFVNIFVMITLIVATVFLFYVKVLSESGEKKRRAEFLKCMGMRRKERIALLRRELYLFYIIPYIIAVVLSVAFTFATFYARMYTVADMKCYLRLAVPVWFAYGVFEWIVIWIFGRISIHSAEGKNE